MLSSFDSPNDHQLVSLRNAVGAAFAGFVLTVIVGFIVKTNFVSDPDARVFDWLVPKLQSNSALIDLAEFVTPIATINVGRIGGIVIGIIGALYHRKLIWLLLPPITMFAAQSFQNLIIQIVGRDNPLEHVIGKSGGFFSGGVMRAIILSAMLVTVLWPRLGDRRTYTAAFFVGLVVAASRMILGRHWPLDVVAAFGVGLGIVALFRMIGFSWSQPGSEETQTAQQ